MVCHVLWWQVVRTTPLAQASHLGPHITRHKLVANSLYHAIAMVTMWQFPPMTGHYISSIPIQVYHCYVQPCWFHVPSQSGMTHLHTQVRIFCHFKQRHQSTASHQVKSLTTSQGHIARTHHKDISHWHDKNISHVYHFSSGETTKSVAPVGNRCIMCNIQCSMC